MRHSKPRIKSKFTRLTNIPSSDEEDGGDKDDIHHQSSVFGKQTRMGTYDGEYDSDEEKEYLENERLQYEQSLLLKQVEQEESKNNKATNKNSTSSRSGSLHSSPNIISPKITSSSSLFSLPSTSTTSTSTNNSNNHYQHNDDDDNDNEIERNISIDIHNLINNNNNNNNNTNNNSNNSSNNNESNNNSSNNNNNNNGNDDDDEVYSNEIGLEAQNILFIQNELSRPLSFYSILKRLFFLFILYLFPVSMVLVIALSMDWNHSCDEPLHSWSIGQVIIQACLISNFLYLLLKLPTQDDNGQPSPEVARVQLIFRNVHNVLSCAWIVWFIVGIVCTFKARAHDTCTSSAPYLFWVSYSVVIFQIVIASLAMLFCCCSCIFSLMRLGVHIEMVQAAGAAGGMGLPGDSRGATDSMLRKLSTKKYKAGVTLPLDDCSCAICLTDYVDGEKIRILPCKHHYHLNCIDRWLIQNKSCPFCKRDIDHTNDTPQSSSTNNNSNNTTTNNSSNDQDGIEMTILQSYDSQM